MMPNSRQNHHHPAFHTQYRSTRLPLFPPLRTQHPQHRNLIARMKLRAAQAVFPGLQRQFTAFGLMEPDLRKKSGTYVKANTASSPYIFAS